MDKAASLMPMQKFFGFIDWSGKLHVKKFTLTMQVDRVKESPTCSRFLGIVEAADIKTATRKLKMKD